MDLRAARRSPHLPPLAVIGIAFAGSRVLAAAAGVTFDRTPLVYFWQYLEPDLLRHRLVESVFYLHSQPPLFNLFLGVVLKLFPGGYGAAVHAVYVALGLGLGAVVYGLATRLGARRWPACAVAVAIVVSPPALVFENWLFYEYPVVVLVAASMLALSWFADGPTVRRGLVLFGLLAAVVLTRTLYSLVWPVAIAGLLLIALPERRRIVVRAAAVPLLLVCLIYVKNVAIVGTPLSWAGPQLAAMTVSGLKPAERARLVARGDLSRVSAVPPFSSLQRYRGLVEPAKRRGIPALDRPAKPASYRGLRPGPPYRAGAPIPNLNQLTYVRISRRYLSDSFWVIGHRPGVYVRRVRLAVHTFFRPSTDYEFVERNRRAISSYDRVFRKAVLLQIGREPFRREGVSIVVAYLAAFVFGTWLLARLVRERRRPTAAETTVLAMWLTVIYVGVVSCLLDLLENQRDRLSADPLVALLVLVAVSWLVEARRGRRGTAA